jgi:hypothetical protein
MPDGFQILGPETSNAQKREEEEEARERMLNEQAKIQQHYKRLVQQRQESENNINGGMPPPPPPPQFPGSEDVYNGDANLPASLAAARPGSRTGITGTPSDPRFANFEEIQRHLSRRPAQYHSQVSTSMFSTSQYAN